MIKLNLTSSIIKNELIFHFNEDSILGDRNIFEKIRVNNCIFDESKIYIKLNMITIWDMVKKKNIKLKQLSLWFIHFVFEKQIL